jgi:hypothetical protein
VTKFTTMRVRVPTDDAVLVGETVERLEALLEAKGTEHLDPEDAGEPASDLGGKVRGPRIHWGAAEVVQRDVPQPQAGKRKKA